MLFYFMLCYIMLCFSFTKIRYPKDMGAVLLSFGDHADDDEEKIL